MLNWLLCFAAICLSALDAFSQNRWVVGPGGYPSIQSAYFRCAPGDIILVRIPSDTITTLSGKGVSIIGDGITPTIQTVQRGTIFYPSWTSIIENVPAGQVMYMENLKFEGGLHLKHCDGGVMLHRIEARRSIHDGYEHGLKIWGCHDIVATRCLFSGNADLRIGCIGRQVAGAVSADSSGRISIFDCELREGPTGIYNCGSPNYQQYFYATEPVALLGSHSGRLRVSLASSRIVASAPAQVYAEYANLSLSEMQVHILVTANQVNVADYGNGVSLAGIGTISQYSRVLPRLQALLSPGSLDLSGSESEPGAAVFVGFSMRPTLFAFEDIGHHGMLVMDLDRSRSGLLDIALADSSGGWARTFPVSPMIRSALQDQVFLLQGLELDAGAKVWCSGAAVVRF